MNFLEKIILDDDMTSAEREIALYGIHALFEMAMAIIICFSIMCVMKMYLEGMIFFAMFIPLRSFAGGYHCEKCWLCMLTSSLLFWSVLIVSRINIMNSMYSYIASLCCIGGIMAIAPVINDARPVLEKEYGIFARRLLVLLLCIVGIETVLLYFNMQHYLQLIAVILCFMLIVLFWGKWKWKELNKHNTYWERFLKQRRR